VKDVEYAVVIDGFGGLRHARQELGERAHRRGHSHRVDIRPVPWARGLAEVASGRAFALFPPCYRPSARPPKMISTG